MAIYVPGKLVLRQQYIGTDDPDAAAYITAVEAADGESLETAVQVAIHSFVKGCKADGIWPALKASCIMAGARTLSGALVPLVGTAPTNYNFVAGDYDRKTGLAGNATDKYLSSGYAFPASLQNNCHISGYFSVNDTAGVNVGAYGDISANGSYLSSRSARLYQASLSTFTPSDASSTGFRGVSRNLASNYLYRRAKENKIANISSTTIVHQDMGIFARRRESGSYDAFSDARISFYSIGESLDLALLDARVTDLINAIGVAIP